MIWSFPLFLALSSFAPFTSGARPDAALAVDTLRMRLLWEVVEGKHPTADSLGQLSGVAIDSRGNVYVSDLSNTTIWVFDPAGRSRQTIGRKGEGPGEFQAPTGLAVAPDGSLYVRDVARITRFTVDPATGLLARYAGSFRGPAMSDWMSPLATRFDAAGNLFLPVFNSVDRSQQSGYFLRYSPSGTKLDSLIVPAFPNNPTSTAYVRLSASGGRMLRGLSHVPFAPLPTWDITPRGTLITGIGNTYLIREIDRSGRDVRAYRGTGASDQIPSRERAESAAALRARLDSVPVPLDQVHGMPSDVRNRQIPTVFPAFMAAYAPPDGMVWVRRWTSGGSERTVFDVFAPDGHLARVVTLPGMIAMQPTPVLSFDGVVAVWIDPDTGAQGIRRFIANTQ